MLVPKRWGPVCTLCLHCQRGEKGERSLCTTVMLAQGSVVMQHVLPSPCLSFPYQLIPLSPQQCSMGPSSDKALSFMKDHFLMDGKVTPIQGQPLLVKSNVTYTHITVDETRGVSGTMYRVMFLATGGFIWGCTQGYPSNPSLISEASVMSPVPHR